MAKVQLSKLTYPKGIIRRVLLLHTIQTMLNNRKEDSKFPFDRYKEERWDMEHINAVGEDMPGNERYQEDWLKETALHLDGNPEARAGNFVKADFAKLYREILKWFSEQESADEANGIANLVLLDSKTNRSYKNAVFPVKRSKIIQCEKNGTFVHRSTSIT